MSQNTPISKYTGNLRPIFSIGAGYQSYYPWAKSAQTYTDGSVRRDTMGKKDSQILYHKTTATAEKLGATNLFNASPVLGYYAGNRILSERYQDNQAGYLTPTESDQMVSSFVSNYGAAATPILDTYLKGTRPDFRGVMSKAIKTSKVPAGEEQYRAVGGRKPAKGKFGAQGIDIANAPHFGHMQVTTERLQKNSHHGIYGSLGKSLGKNVQELKTLHRKGIISRDRAHKEIANDGLSYFQQRVPTWNTALSTIRQTLINQQKAPSARNLASTIRQGDNAVAKLSDMAMDAQHFMKNKSATIVLQAIGNLRYFGNAGVTYSYAVGPLTHLAISSFLMNPTSFQFDLSKLNSAEIVDGTYDITDMFFARESTGLTAMNVAEKRAFAHNAYRASQQAMDTETNSINSLHAGGLLANSARFQASIDMVHADKDMHHLITQGIIPEVRQAYEDSSKKYSSDKLQAHKGSIDFGSRGKFGWALPYISIFDTSMEKTGRR